MKDMERARVNLTLTTDEYDRLTEICERLHLKPTALARRALLKEMDLLDPKEIAQSGDNFVNLGPVSIEEPITRAEIEEIKRRLVVLELKI
jgi:hypothetical protein